MTRTNIIDGGLGTRTLATSRLSLRWIVPGDAAALALYGGEPLIHQKTDTIPYPYDEKTAMDWISESEGMRHRGEAYRFAVISRETGAFIGVCALAIVDREKDVAELGYWLGRPFWDKGFGREAVAALIAFGRDILQLAGIRAIVYAENTASVAVLRGQDFVESEYEMMDVPERGGNRLVRLFSLELKPGVSTYAARSHNNQVA
jgi:RimJ/RimL family protein N-acetyltransferase